jgi:hypothetical protein
MRRQLRLIQRAFVSWKKRAPFPASKRHRPLYVIHV